MATTEAPIAAIAAEAGEFSGLLSHATSVEAVRSGAAYCCRAVIGGRSWLLAADGAGPARAEAAAGAALNVGPVAGLLSTGFCGGLDPVLSVGDVFVAGRVIDGRGSEWPACMPSKSGATQAAGALLSTDKVVVTALDKRSLWESLGAQAVEMEAAGVARLALARGLPFYCIRVVSDAAGEPLPMDFNLYRDSAGRFQRGRILGAALLRPPALGGLIRLYQASKQAARSLGDFLVNCRF